MTSLQPVRKSEELLAEHQLQVYRRTDKTFAVLMIVQWLAGIIAAIWLSPLAWAGVVSTLHPHVVAAVVLGGVAASLPVLLALARPGHAITRHVIAVAQVLFSALFIHLSGGRIETHFHVFGSLAFLSCYRDWRVLISASAVVLCDHLLRGALWPASVYGVLSAPVWRSFEHAGWVLFEDIVLFIAIRQSVTEMRNVAATGQAMAEAAEEVSKSEEALRNQSQILESVLTSMGDGVIVADKEGRFLVFNPAAEHILGRERMQIPLEQWTAAYGVCQSDGVTPCPVPELPLVRAMRGEPTDANELFITRPEGEGNWISVSGRPLKVSNGALLGGLVVFRDVTAAKHSEAALHAAKQTAEAANVAKSEFLANMSHEIRTPLTSILGYTDLLRRGIGTKEQHTVYLDTISSSGRHLSTLIDDILDLSKIEAGRMEFEQVRCSPHQIVSEVLSVLRVRAQERSLRLECQWAGGVPESIVTDPARLRQLLMNVIGNAIKFTEQGGVRLLASIVPQSAQPHLLIEVHDTGIGIPPDRIQYIFEPFEQADTSITRRFGGTGLGLAICRHIARGLGGEITAESVLGLGSVFRIALPTGSLDQVPILGFPPGEALTSAASSRTERITQLPECHVLLVEDGESNRELISLVLQEAGAKVTCADNGLEGLALEASNQFDLILMDMQMPIMDGYSAAQQLRARGCQLPIIALTAHAMRGDRDKCMVAGCSGYLAKPIDLDDLLCSVEAALKPQQLLAHSAPPNNVRVQQLSDTQLPSITSTLPLDNPRFRELVEAFVNRMHGQLEKMRHAQQTSDWQALAELGHWLRGSGGTLGFSCFTEPAHQLELSAKTQQLREVELAISEIESLAARISPEQVEQTVQ